MKTRKLALVSAALIGLFAFGLFAKRAPDWISGFSKKYPEQTYLIGIGLGENLDEARSAARAEIAKVFWAQIVQSSKEFKQETSIQQGSKIETSAKVQAESETKVFTEDILQGVEIADTWFDEKNKTYYALAILDKLKTRALLSIQIVDQEEIIQTQFTAAKKSGSPIEEIRALSAALQSWDKKESLLAKKRIVDPVPVPELSAGPSPVEIQKQKEEALSKIIFVVDLVKEEENSNLKGVIGEVISKTGFRVSPAILEKIEPDSLVIIIRCQLAVEPFNRDNPQWKFYRWQGNIEMVEGVPNGKVLATTSRQGEVSQITEATAKIKAITEARQTLALAVEQQIRAYIFGEGAQH